MSGSRKRTYEPSGVLVPAGAVRIYTRDCPGERRPYKVNVRLLGHGERTESFEKSTPRDRARNRLAGAAANDEAFDTGSFQPTSWGAPAPPNRMGLVDFLAKHGQAMAAEDKAKTRSSRFEAHMHIALAGVSGPDTPPRSDRWEYLRAVLTPVIAELGELSDAAERAARVVEVVNARLACLTAGQQKAGVWLREHQPDVSTLTPAWAAVVLEAFRSNPVKAGKAAGTTRTRKKNALHHALEAAVSAELLDSNPMDRVKVRRGYANSKLRVVNREVVMTPAQGDEFIRQVGLDDEGNEDADVSLCGYFALQIREGLRPSEANAVRVSWFRRPTQSGEWPVLMARGALVEVGAGWTDDGDSFADNPLKHTDLDGVDEGDIRAVPVSPETWELIAPLLAGKKPSDRVFSSRSGGPVTGAVRSRIVRKARERMFADEASEYFQSDLDHPLRTLAAYALRHSAASAHLNSGMPPKEAARRLGHDLHTLLTIYAAVMDGDEEVGNRRLAAYRAQYAHRKEVA